MNSVQTKVDKVIIDMIQGAMLWTRSCLVTGGFLIFI